MDALGVSDGGPDGNKGHAEWVLVSRGGGLRKFLEELEAKSKKVS